MSVQDFREILLLCGSINKTSYDNLTIIFKSRDLNYSQTVQNAQVDHVLRNPCQYHYRKKFINSFDNTNQPF